MAPKDCLIFRSEGSLCYHISSAVFSFQNTPKDLDPSYKMELDLWDCLRINGKIRIIAKFHGTDLVIHSHFREGKTLSYS